MDRRDSSTGGDGHGRIVILPDDDGVDASAPEESERALLFRLKAEEARSAARSMTDAGARRTMRHMAGTYDRLARHAAGRDVSQDRRSPERDAVQSPSSD